MNGLPVALRLQPFKDTTAYYPFIPSIVRQ